MHNLWADLSLALDADVELLHLTSEPVSLGEVASSIFGTELAGLPSPVRYDFQTKLASLWGKSARYQYSAKQAHSAIRGYFES
jgi:hypothetical protein